MAEFAGKDGNQLFVRTGELDGVAREIGSYVGDHGCEGMYEAVDDRLATLAERRDRRTFSLAPPRDGWVTVWEDGVLADRRLAAHLSKALDTEVRWLMVSSSTDSWAEFAYADGEQTGSTFEDDVDAVARAGAFAERHGLPHALRYLRDPTLGDYLASLDVPAVEALGIDMRAAAAGAPADEGPEGLVEKVFPCAT